MHSHRMEGHVLCSIEGDMRVRLSYPNSSMLFTFCCTISSRMIKHGHLCGPTIVTITMTGAPTWWAWCGWSGQLSSDNVYMYAKDEKSFSYHIQYTYMFSSTQGS